MRYFLFISILFFLSACKVPYESVQRVEGDVREVNKFRPAYNSILYQAQVDVVGKHLSGLLLLKQMPDSSKRVVFSNEMGVKYFDFEFRNDGSFTVPYIIKDMNRKPVINTLRSDFELIMLHRLDYDSGYIKQDSLYRYYIFPHEKEVRYYITDVKTGELVRVESGSKGKIKVKAMMMNYFNNVPDTVSISHQSFNFTIGLKRLIR